MTPKIYRRYYDIVILPPKPVSEYAIKLSRTLVKDGAKWTLGQQEYIPHISLYHIPVKPKDWAPFIETLTGVVKDCPGGQLRTTELKYNLLMLDKPAWLQRLYLKVIKQTRPYFDWDYGVENLWHLDKFPASRQRSMRRYLAEYGTPMMGVNFEPHITLTVFQDRKVKVEQISELQFKRFTFAVDRLFICELGPSHSCQRIVEELRF